MEITCLYCESVIQKPSKEHLFQRAIGGRATRKDLACADCNNTFGNGIDKSLADTTAPIANLLNISTQSRGGSAPVLNNLATTDGQRVNLLPGGRPVLQFPKKIETKEEGERKHVRIHATSEEELRHLSAKILKGARDVKVGVGQQVRNLRPQIQIDFAIDGAVRRALGKLLLHVASKQVSRGALRGPAFRRLRDWIYRGPDTLPLIRFVPAECGPIISGLSDFSHHAAIWVNEDNTVQGTVTLFGGIHLGGTLAESYHGERFCVIGVCDPVAGKETFEKIGEFSQQLPDCEYLAELKMFQDQLSDLLRRVSAYQQRAYIDEQIHVGLTRLFDQWKREGCTETGDEEISEICELAGNVVGELLQNEPTADTLSIEEISRILAPILASLDPI